MWAGSDVTKRTKTVTVTIDTENQRCAVRDSRQKGRETFLGPFESQVSFRCQFTTEKILKTHFEVTDLF